MKYIISILIAVFFTSNVFSCDYLELDQDVNNQLLMGKKSKFYDAYKQGKCVLENALEPLTVEQREIIANLIAKSYKFK